MSYIEKTLSKDEEIISQHKFHWWQLGYPLLVTIAVYWAGLAVAFAEDSFLPTVFGLGMFAAPIWLLGCIIAKWTTEQVLTNKRVFLKVGLIRRDTDEIAKEKIETISIRQSILGRILGFGNLEFTGTGNTELHFRYVADPTGAKRNFENLE